MARPVWTAQCTAGRLVRELLPVRRRESHKGDYGRVLLLCGSEGLTGAARLAAKGALRTGSGLVYLGVPEKIYPIIAAGAGSEIVFPLPCDEEGRLCMASLPAITARLENVDAVLLGPGLGRSEELTRLVQAVLLRCRAPLVLDADGINAVAGHIDVLRGCACPVVLTPHDGEFLRLGGDPKADDRTRETMRLASRSHAVVLLKGSRTVITDGLNTYVNHTGNPGLATGGSGDVLAGMIVSLLCIGFYFMCGAALGLPSVFLLVFFLAYIFCCAVSICAVVWVLLSEMYPTRVRGLAMSIAGLALWVGTYLIGQLTPWMLENLTPAGTFFLFAAMCVPYMLIIWRAVPETTGRSLEEIEKYWQKNE